MFSAALSVLSLTHGHVKHISAEKNNFLPWQGVIIQTTFAICAILGRLAAILLFLAPILGLANLLMHWKMGQLPVGKEKDNTYPQQLTFDAQNGEIIYFETVWVPTPEYTSFTLWELETYYLIFLVLIPLHLALVFALKHLLAFGFR